MKSIKVGTVCSGVGCPEQALRNLGIPFEVAYYCELDRFASASYHALHKPQAKNLGDLTALDLDSLPYVDLLVGGTPCQDFSVAGKGAGGEEGSGTRSSLMWNFLQIIGRTKPHWVLWENVKNACRKGNKANFDKFLAALRGYGYAVSYKVLNAKDYGIPQNRERVFVVGELNGKNFVFPPKQPLKLRLKDVLEDNVDEKYYLSDEQVKRIEESGFTQKRTSIKNVGGGAICRTLTARDHKDPTCVRLYEAADGEAPTDTRGT